MTGAAHSVYKYLPANLAERLRGLGITVRRPVEGQMQGLHRSPHHGSSVEFSEYREYTPGDPVDLIDWAVYARSDRYVIRRFHEETNLRAYILLDTSESMAFRDEGPVSKMDYASYLAAGIMYVLVNQGDSAGLVTFDSGMGKVFEPVGTFDGLRPLLLWLEEIDPSGRSDIEEAVHEAAVMLRSRSLVVIISDLLQNPSQVLRGIRHLFHDGHNVMILHVMDPSELRLSFAGTAELRELETGRRMVVEVDEIRDAYGTEVGRYLDELRIGCTECLADYHLIETSNPVEESLRLLRGAGGTV